MERDGAISRSEALSSHHDFRPVEADQDAVVIGLFYRSAS
jgi:hypothetical protein